MVDLSTVRICSHLLESTDGLSVTDEQIFRNDR